MSRPEVLVLDDGNLDGVCAVLEELGAEFSCVLTTDLGGLDLESPARLLVASGRLALALPATGEPWPARVAVVEEGSPDLGPRLRERGFDFLVRQPCHPATLRLLLQSLLVRPERRSAVRTHLDAVVACQTDLRDRPARLVDLSPRGCALETTWAEDPDTPIRIQLPKELTGDDATLTLPGWVLRCDPGAGDAPGYRLGVVFGELTAGSGRRLAALLAARAA